MLAGSLLALLPASRAEADPGCVGPPSQTRVYVTVEGIRSSEGLIATTLYADDPRRFLVRRGALYVGRVPAQAPTQRVCLFVPGPGVYAIAVYHDANANLKIDRNAIGLPSEGFGFSNDASTLLGLPLFGSVRIRLTPNLETHIRLRYLHGDELRSRRP